MEGIIGPEVILSAETPSFKRQNLSYCLLLRFVLKVQLVMFYGRAGIDPPLKQNKPRFLAVSLKLSYSQDHILTVRKMNTSVISLTMSEDVFR